MGFVLNPKPIGSQKLVAARLRSRSNKRSIGIPLLMLQTKVGSHGNENFFVSHGYTRPATVAASRESDCKPLPSRSIKSTHSCVATSTTYFAHFTRGVSFRAFVVCMAWRQAEPLHLRRLPGVQFRWMAAPTVATSSHPADPDCNCDSASYGRRLVQTWPHGLVARPRGRLKPAVPAISQ